MSSSGGSVVVSKLGALVVAAAALGGGGVAEPAGALLISDVILAKKLARVDLFSLGLLVVVWTNCCGCLVSSSLTMVFARGSSANLLPVAGANWRSTADRMRALVSANLAPLPAVAKRQARLATLAVPVCRCGPRPGARPLAACRRRRPPPLPSGSVSWQPDRRAARRLTGPGQVLFWAALLSPLPSEAGQVWRQMERSRVSWIGCNWAMSGSHASAQPVPAA